jgi:hypothetical protein
MNSDKQAVLILLGVFVDGITLIAAVLWLCGDWKAVAQ